MSWECKFTRKMHNAGITSLAVSGRNIISGSHDDTVKVLNVDSLTTQTLNGHTNSVTSVAVLGDKIISGSRDHTVRVWDLETGDARILDGHTDWVTSVAVLGDNIISGSEDFDVKVWESNTVRTIVHGGGVRCVMAFGDMIVSGYWGAINVYGNKNYTLKTGNVISMAVLGNKIVYTDGYDIILWNPKDGSTHTFNAMVNGINNWVNAVAVLGDKIIYGSGDFTVKILDVNGNRQTLFGHESAVTSVAVFGDKIVSGSSDGFIKVWEMDNNVVFGETKTLEEQWKEHAKVELTDRVLPQIPWIFKPIEEEKDEVYEIRKLQREREHGGIYIYTFVCMKEEDRILMPNMNVYAYCAYALYHLAGEHRMEVYDTHATYDDILATIQTFGSIDEAWLKAHVALRLSIQNAEKLEEAVKVNADETLALLYLSAHGDDAGIIYIEDQPVDNDWMQMIGAVRDVDDPDSQLSEDFQVMLNGCSLGRKTALAITSEIDDHFVLGCTGTIPSGTVRHMFKIADGRLYFSAIGFYVYYSSGSKITVYIKNKEVMDDAFASEKISRVVLAGVKRIGPRAFAECAFLERVESSSVESIGEQAFLNCSRLTEVFMPNIRTMAASAYEGCDLLNRRSERLMKKRRIKLRF